MLPGSRSVYGWTMSMVTSPAPKGDDHAAADPAGDPGPRRPGRAGTPLPHHPRRHHPDPLPDRAAQRPRPYPTPDRAVGQVQRRHRASGAQPLFGRRRRRGAAPAAPWPAAPLSARLGAGVGPGGRSGPARGGGGQRVVDVSAAGRLPAPGDRVSGGDRERADRVAPGGVCVQAAPLGAVAQGAGAAGVGKKRVRVEALLAAAAAAVPPPAVDLVPDATLADALMPEDLPRLLGLLERADLYLQDEVEVALHPTLTRVWSRAGRAGQRLVQAPGKNFKRCGFGLVDWRDGHLDFQLADGRRAGPLPARARAAGSPWWSWTTWASTRPRGRGCCARCWPNWANSWCWSTRPPTIPMPTASSGCGGPYAAASPTPTSVRSYKTCWPTPTGGPARSPQPRSLPRSAARSRSITGRCSRRNSTMRHELPGSI